MKRVWLKDETEKWVEEGIINNEQRDQILSRYQNQQQFSLVFFFAAILIGLSCLTFVAANWQVIPDAIRMILIIVFLLTFYSLGFWFDQKKNSNYSVFCYVIALAIFGAGIFLTGQMFHYSMNNVFAFIVWGLAAYLLYLSRPHLLLLLSGIVIVTVGQIYGLSNMHDFDWLLFGLFMVGYGAIVFSEKKPAVTWLFAISYLIQLIGFSLDQLNEIYWLIIFALVLYAVGTYVKEKAIRRPFQWVPLIFMFVLNLFQTFNNQPNHPHFMFWIIWVVLIGLAVYLTFKKQHRLSLIQLVLFLPVFAIYELTPFISYLVLYVFSIGKLFEGYQFIDQRKIQLGTGAFLISTLLVYIQFAWDFLDKSLFFLIGGLILFIMGFLLERHRQKVLRDQKEDV